MSLPFFEAFTQSFAPAQRRALEDAALRGDTLGEDELAALAAKIEEGTKPLFEAPEFGLELLDGCKVATALETIRIDLTALLQQAQTLEAISTKHSVLHRNLVKRLHQSVLRLDELLLTNKHRRLNTGYNDIKFIDFYNSQNDAGTVNRARVESDTGQLVGGALVLDRYMTRGGELTPKFTTRVVSTGTNPDSRITMTPSDATRDNDDYVWAEVLLSDSRLNGMYDAVEYAGALVELTIELPQAEDINEIKIAPFGRYPLQLIAAKYDNGQTTTSIPDVTLPLTLELDVTALRFDTINARIVQLVFYQPEYQNIEYIFEQGQLKRSNILNLMLEGSIKQTIAGQGKLDHALRDSRRDRAKAALDAQLKLQKQINPLDRYRQAITNVLNVGDEKLVRVVKSEYVVGLRVLEINYRRYAQSSEYRSPKLRAGGSVFGLALETTETHVSNEDDNPVTAVHWEVDLGGGHVLDILPDNVDTIHEVLEFDSLLEATTRFDEDDGNPTRTVYMDGVELTLTTHYTLSAPAADTPITVTLNKNAWSPIATYSIVYRPNDTSKAIEVLDIYNSIKPIKPELFTKTDAENRIDLMAHPFVLTELTRNAIGWVRIDPFDAIWQYDGPPTRTANTDRPFVVLIDGEYFGENPTVTADNGAGADITSATSPIRILNNAGAGVPVELDDGFPSTGVIRINSEYIKYTAIASAGSDDVEISGLTRGYNNTDVPTAHAAGSAVTWITTPYYEPISVVYNGQHCRNRTEYATGRNPAFSDDSGAPQYIQIGSSLYFDRPLNGRIEVKYRRLVDYIVVRAKLWSTNYAREHTAMVNNYVLKLKTATL